MSFKRGIYCYFIVWLYCMNYGCQCHGITTREAKSFFQSRPSPFIVTNDFTSIYRKKDGFKEEKNESGKQREVDDNQISWTSGSSPVTSTESSGKNFWLTEFGETDKIITVRVSSSVARPAWKTNYVEKPKLAALQRIGFGVEVPAPKMSTAGYNFPYHPGYSPSPLWVQHTTETPPGNDSGGTYYETRIEAVSSRRQVVFGKPKTVITTTPQNFYQEPREEFCEMPETNYELPEKNYEVDEAVSLMTNGNPDGVLSGEKSKLGYVMEGRDFRKYRVEERTPDGFIVGEYGFIRNDDGKLHGVRYTADVSANPRLIYDALIKFLSL